MSPDASGGQELARLAGAFATLVAELHDVSVVLFDHELRLWEVGGPAPAVQGWREGELHGRTLAELLPAEVVGPLAGHYRAALAGERRSFDTPGFKDPGRTWAVTVSPVRDHDGTVVGGLVVAQDASARLAAQAAFQAREAELLRRAEAGLAERLRWLEALHQITATILDGSSLDASLSLIARLGRVLAGADLAALTVPAGRPGQLRLHSVDGAHAELLRAAELPVAGSVAGEVFSTGRPVVLRDAAADPRTSQPVVRLGLFGPAMFLPLQVRGTVFGTLTVARLSGAAPFGQDELTLVQTFADQAAMAYEYARAQGEAQRVAVLEDRERIGGELHDAVIQNLFAIGLHLQAAAAMTPGEPGQRIEAAVADLDRTMEELRRDIFGLRVGVAPDRRLERALQALGGDLEQQAGLTAVLDLDQATAAALGDRTSEIVGLVRAALARPPGGTPSTCRIRLHTESGRAVLVLDGDDAAPAPDQRRLRVFAQRLGAELEVGPDPAGGRIVLARLPLPPV